MADYPAELPPPDREPYAGTQDSGLRRTNTPVQLFNQQVGYNAPRREVALSFSMSNDTYLTWIAWFQANAYKWFDIPIVSGAPSTELLTPQTVRCISALNYTKRGDGWLTVSFTVEIQPKQTNFTL